MLEGASHGGTNGNDILNEFDLSLLDPRLMETQDGAPAQTSRAFQLPGIFHGGNDMPLSSPSNYGDWVLKGDDAASFLESLSLRDSPTFAGSQSPEFFAPDHILTSQDMDSIIPEALPVQRTSALNTPSKSGKQPVYMWPPQSDPELEKKRQRALKAYNNRQKVSQRERVMQNQIEYMKKIIRQLQSDKKALELKLAQVESQLSLFKSERSFGY